MSTTPAALFSLNLVARFEADGTEWVAYDDDGTLTDVVEADEWDAEIDPDDYGHRFDTDGAELPADYSLWCASTSTPGVDVYRAGMREAGDRHWSTGAHGGVSAALIGDRVEAGEGEDADEGVLFERDGRLMVAWDSGVQTPATGDETLVD